MSGSGIVDASGVLFKEVGRSYMGVVPNPVDGDLVIDPTKIQNFTNINILLQPKLTLT